jgi:hypothetical protein
MDQTPNVRVGWGPVTITGIVTAVTAGLLSVATFLTTLTGSLPTEVSDKYGFWIATVAGVISALAQAITAAARSYFANTKVQLASAEAYSTNGVAITADVSNNQELFVDDPVVSDTNVTPTETPVD